jgi:hypothetical protein
LQVGDTGPVESARRSNSRVLGSPFSGLSGQLICAHTNILEIQLFMKKSIMYVIKTLGRHGVSRVSRVFHRWSKDK